MSQRSKKSSELKGNNAVLCVKGISAFLLYKKMQMLRGYEADNSNANRNGHGHPKITGEKEEK